MQDLFHMDPYSLADALEQCSANETCRGCKLISKEYNCVSKLMASAAALLREQAEAIQKSDYSGMMKS